MKQPCDLCKKQKNVLVSVRVSDGNFQPNSVDKNGLYCRACLATVKGD